MKFGTRGKFKTEDIIEIAMRSVAELQDAGVEYVSGVNLYLTPIDQKGRQRTILKNGKEVDHIRPDLEDLALPEADPIITTVNTEDYHAARRKPASGRSRKYARNQ